MSIHGCSGEPSACWGMRNHGQSCDCHMQTPSGVEVYYIRSPSDLQQLLKKRRKKANRKSKGSEDTEVRGDV